MLKFVLTWEWGAGSGHLLSLKPIAQILNGAGHEVILILRDLRFVSHHFELDNGLIKVKLAPTIPSALPKHWNPLNFCESAANLGYVLVQSMTMMLIAWSDLVNDLGAHGIIEHR